MTNEELGNVAFAVLHEIMQNVSVTINDMEEVARTSVRVAKILQSEDVNKTVA